jgi:hypothetical protein
VQGQMPVCSTVRTDPPVRSQSAAELAEPFGDQQNQPSHLQVCCAINTALRNKRRERIVRIE